MPFFILSFCNKVPNWNTFLKKDLDSMDKM